MAQQEAPDYVKKQLYTNSGSFVPYLFCLFHLRSLWSLGRSEGAKIEFAQAQKELANRQKKANYEDAIVQNLESIRETLLNANIIQV
jgi:hypothetical protein